ncbi:hypothetical protein FRC20_010901 [Serendipita sp. 405]|nr:hypothetical protein FRC20_010901 [Serendipita sp. 405]
MSIHLLMSRNSVRNTTFSCDSLGIHYDVSRNKESGVVTVQRWDSTTDSNVFVGEFYLSWFKPDRVRMGPDGQWMSKKRFLYKEGRNPISAYVSFIGLATPIFSVKRLTLFLNRARTFEAADGTKYRWKLRWNKLQLCYASSENKGKAALVMYHRHYTAGKVSYLEVNDSSVLEALDPIIVSFLIMEKERRDRDKAAQRS